MRLDRERLAQRAIHLLEVERDDVLGSAIQ
jgi:hypothetical protein